MTPNTLDDHERKIMATKKIQLIRLRDVCEQTALSKTAIYRALREDRFPKPVRVGPHSVRWRQDELDEWIDGLDRSRGDLAS